MADQTQDGTNNNWLGILQHSLGLDKYGRGSRFRNHFVTGSESTDWPYCRQLVDVGLMFDYGSMGALTGGNNLFVVTAAGIKYIEEHSPNPPKISRSQRRYQQFLSVDCGLTFCEWLGVKRS